MKAAFALLADAEVHNLVRRIAWEMHLKHGTGTTHCRLPPHVSLKQPFSIADLAGLERYMAELAGSIEPFAIHLTELQVVPTVFEGKEYGILWADVEESTFLRSLHERVNNELSRRFGSTQADHDGREYHFHLTVMIGGKPVEVYHRFYRRLADPSLNVKFTTRELAMFVYDEPLGEEGEYLCYRILPLGTGTHATMG